VSKDLPSLKLLLNLRGTWRRYLILPVPVVFLLIAFTLQLSDFLEEAEITESENYMKFPRKMQKASKTCE
jgi:hypothetical protein